MRSGGARTLGRVVLVVVSAVLLSATFGVVNASALPTGSIAGLVVDDAAAPVAGVTVEVLNATYGNVVGTTSTAVDGTYLVSGLNPNKFRVRFTSASATHPILWNNGALTWGTAPKLTVTANTTTSANVSLSTAGTVSGTVSAGTTPKAGLVAVVLNTTLPLEALGAAMTAADGSYSIPRMPPGPVKVGFVDLAFLNSNPAIVAQSYRSEMFDDLDMISMSLAGAFAAADLVAVTSSASTDVDASLVGLDCTMAAGANLSGQNLSNKNLKGCGLQATNLAGTNLTNATLQYAVGEPGNTTGTIFSNTTCPDGTNSNDVANAGACHWSALGQSITFTSSTNHTWVTAPDYTVSATATSGLPVTFSLGAGTTPGSCTLVGSTVHFAAAGTCEVVASQAGNGTYSAAPNVSQVLDVGGAVGVDCAAAQAEEQPAVSLAGLDLHNCNFNGFDFTATDFTGAMLYGATLTSTTLADADFTNADLSSASLAFGLAIGSLTFTNATMVNTNMGSMFTIGTVDMTGAAFNGGTLASTFLIDLRLPSAVLTGATGPGSSTGITYNSATVCSDGSLAAVHGNSCAGVGAGW